MRRQLFRAACLLLWSPLLIAQEQAQHQHGQTQQQQSGAEQNQQPPPPAQPPMGEMPGMQHQHGQMQMTPQQQQQQQGMPLPPNPSPGRMQTEPAQPPSTSALPNVQLPMPEKTGTGPVMTLEQFDQLAVANNPTLAQARSEIRAAKGRRNQAGLYPNPTVGYSGEEIKGGESRGGEQGFFVQQNIITGGKLGLSRQIFEQERRQAEAELNEQQLRVTNSVHALYYQTLAAQTMVIVRRQLSAIAADAVQTTQQLFNVGQADSPDALEAEVEANRAQLQVIEAQQNELRAWRSLAAAVGKPDLPLARLAGSLEDIPDVNTEEWLARMVSESPAVKIAQLDIDRTQAVLARARREPIPDLQLRGGLQQNRELRELTQRPVGLQGFAEVGVQIPIFNRNQGNVQAARADVERAQREVERVKLLLQQRAADLIRNYQSTRASAERYRVQMLPRAARAYDLYVDKYRSMAAAYPQVLVAQRTLFQLQDDYVTALENLWTSAVAIQSFMLTDGLEAPSRPGEMTTPIREVNLPSMGVTGSQPR